MNWKSVLLFGSISVCAIACSKPGPVNTGESQAPVAAPIAPSANSANSINTTNGAAPSAPEKDNRDMGKWAGSYKSSAGQLYVPAAKDWAATKWRGDDAGVGLGDGALSFSVDSASGRISGEGDGAIGPVRLSGVLSSGMVSLSISRKDPGDLGFTGTGMGRLEQDKLVGTMRLSLAGGNVIREAKFELTRTM